MCANNESWAGTARGFAAVAGVAEMTDVITEARRLAAQACDHWREMVGQRQCGNCVGDRAAHVVRALLSATGAAEARVTALEQEFHEERNGLLDDLVRLEVDRQNFERAAMIAEARATAAEAQANAIDCPLCGESVKLVASATLSLALWQHVNWTCQSSPKALQAQLTAVRAIRDEIAAEAEDARKTKVWCDPCQSDMGWHADTYERWVRGLDAALPPTPEAT